MDNQQEPKVGRLLTAEEEKELRDGSALLEMQSINPGWQIVLQILETTGFHSWVDPRGMKKEDWEFAELNAFHASNNAKELLETIQSKISRSDYLAKVRDGTIDTRKFKI